MGLREVARVLGRGLGLGDSGAGHDGGTVQRSSAGGRDRSMAGRDILETVAFSRLSSKSHRFKGLTDHQALWVCFHVRWLVDRAHAWRSLPQPPRHSSTPGPVAQLGERFHGMEEVVGSTPIRSTFTPPPALLAAVVFAGGWQSRFATMAQRCVSFVARRLPASQVGCALAIRREMTGRRRVCRSWSSQHVRARAGSD